MNIAYTHLDSKLRIAEFSLGQWFGVVIGLGVAIVWGFFLSPLGDYLTAASAVYLGALPVGAVLLASVHEVDMLLIVRSALKWRRREGRFVPGPGVPAGGYVVHAEAAVTRAAEPEPHAFDLAELWES